MGCLGKRRNSTSRNAIIEPLIETVDHAYCQGKKLEKYALSTHLRIYSFKYQSCHSLTANLEKPLHLSGPVSSFVNS